MAKKISGASDKSPIRATSQDALELIYSRSQWRGMRSLGDEELLLLLFSDAESNNDSTEELASQLCRKGGGLLRLEGLRPQALMEQHKLSRLQATRLAAALELGHRAHRDGLVPHPTQPLSFDQVVRWGRPRLAGLEHEEVWVLCVNSQTSLRSAWQVGKGGIHGCALLARDVLVPVARDGASGFILVHNHPSGDPSPSPEDIELTRGLQLAASSLCIPLLDHVIIAKTGSTSLFELGYLDS